METEERLQFRDLLRLEDEQKALKATIDVLKASCVQALVKHGDSIVVDGIEFSISANRTYSYSSVVNELAYELKKIKKEELQNGVAVLKTDGKKLVKKQCKIVDIDDGEVII